MTNPEYAAPDWALSHLERYHIPVAALAANIKACVVGMHPRFFGLIQVKFPQAATEVIVHYQEGQIVRMEFERDFGSTVVRESCAPMRSLTFRKA